MNQTQQNDFESQDDSDESFDESDDEESDIEEKVGDEKVEEGKIKVQICGDPKFKIGYCPYCAKAYERLDKHLLLGKKHAADCSELRKLKNPKRAKSLAELRKLGNFNHNIKILKEKTGEIIVCKRPTMETSYDLFLPCSSCLGFYAYDDLWRHQCPGKKEGKRVVKKAKAFSESAMNKVYQQ